MTADISRRPSDAHVFRMTDGTGMFQHARYSVPDPSHGYTTDDNARALMMAAMLFETYKDSKYLDLAYRYMRFLLYAWDGKRFRNFMDYDRRFREKKSSEDCFGRCLWCLGYVSDCKALPSGLRTTADCLAREAAPLSGQLRYIRGKANALVGVSRLKDKELVQRLACDIADSFDRSASDGWRWFEDEITYCNAVIPLALLEAYHVAGEKRWLDIGLESLEFLLDATFRGDVFHPVGCKGWYKKGGRRAVYDQQPVEACETLMACLKAYNLTEGVKYSSRAKSCLEWYTGKNIAGVSLIDRDTGGCMDGITPAGPNPNQGAESLVSWLIAWLEWNRAKKSLERKEGND